MPGNEGTQPALPALAAGMALPDCAAAIELLAAFIVSEPGRDACRRLQFERDRGRLEFLQQRNLEARSWLERRGSFGFGELASPHGWLEQARIEGSALEVESLLGLWRWLEAATALREHLSGGEGAWPALEEMAAVMPELPALHQALRATLEPNGEIRDQASPQLHQLRRQRERQRQAIERTLAAHLRRLGDEGVLQDDLITLRNDRYVVPVRAELRRRAAGVVHGASSSGQTVFVEPLETIELNNENIRLREAEQAEIHRLLVTLTARVRTDAAGIEALARQYGALELEMAKARFGAEYGGCAAAFAPVGAERLELEAARHPVLQAVLRRRGEAVVPLSLTMERQRVLVVSGPNTGGKTVVLKTVGMAAWMAHCGLPVCARRAVLPVLSGLWADIGDSQSLEASLSGFSSRLVKVREILAAADASSLVLLDELGTATNAAEGAALAEAIAETLRERRSWTLISTHHDALKAWAAAERGLNASLEINPDTLQPTYQFRAGVPGLSAGLAMAERLGLPPRVVAAARANLSEQQRATAGYLERLQRLVAEAELRETETGARQRAQAEREGGLAARELELDRREKRDRQRDREILRKEWDRHFAELQARLEGEWSAAAERWSEATRRKAAAEAGRLRQRGLGAAAEARPDTKDAQAPGAAVVAQVGDAVRLRQYREPGRVLRTVPGGYEVEIGRLRMKLDAGDVVEVLTAARPGAGSSAPPVTGVRELNLIGQRAEEARERLEKFLDQALLSGVGQVRIIHGFGAGVLRRTVAEALREHPQVAAFTHPEHHLGGEGVTHVTLK